MSNIIKVLLVDDEPAVLRALELLLRSIGDRSLSITSTSNPTTAKEMIESEQQFDLLITDLRMAPVDGFELVRSALSVDGDMRVVVISAYINDELIDKMKGLGCNNFIRKPFKRTELIECLSEMFPIQD